MRILAWLLVFYVLGTISPTLCAIVIGVLLVARFWRFGERLIRQPLKRPDRRGKVIYRAR